MVTSGGNKSLWRMIRTVLGELCVKSARPLRAKRILVAFGVLIWLTISALQASAEWFADLYGGATYTSKSDLTLIVRLPGLSADHLLHDVKWDTSASFGSHVGYWFEALP